METEKAKAVIAAIQANPNRHDQRIWSNIGETEAGYYTDRGKFVKKGDLIECGTVGCFAGHTAFLFAPEGSLFFGFELKLPIDPKLGNHPTFSYEKYASSILGLTPDEEEYLYSPERDLEELIEFVEADEEERHAILIAEYPGIPLMCYGTDCPYPH